MPTFFRRLGSLSRRTRRLFWFGASSASSATAAVTIGSVTCSASATHTAPTFAATSTVTTGAVTCSASATHTVPTFAATASVTIGAVTCSASATHTVPTFTATSAVTIGAVTCAGSATFTAAGAPTTVLITSASSRPSRKTGFARSRSQAVDPNLWPTDAWCPSLMSPGGLILPSLASGKHTGTFSYAAGLPTLWVSSHGKHAVDFTPGGGGTEYATTLDIQQIPLTGTLSIWLKPLLVYNAPGTWNANFEVITNVTNGLDNLIISRLATGNLFVGWYYDPTDGRITIPITAATWDTTVWQNYVVTWAKGVGTKCYRNGVQLGTTTLVPTTRQAGAALFYFGSPGGANGYDGLMDDVRFCDSAWSNDQAMRNFTLGRGGWATKKSRTNIIGVAGPVTYTATASVTTGATTCSASATHTVPTFAATASVTTGAATCSALAQHTVPTFAATASVTIGAVTCSAIASYTPIGTVAATANVSIGNVTCTATATHTKPTFSATSIVSIGTTTCAGLATFSMLTGSKSFRSMVLTR